MYFKLNRKTGSLLIAPSRVNAGVIQGSGSNAVLPRNAACAEAAVIRAGLVALIN